MEELEKDQQDMNLKKYEKEYSESELWKKIGEVAKMAGLRVIYYVLLLYYSLQSDTVTLKEKALIIGALGYFILPVDLVPDFIIGLGYGDDAAALVAVVKMLENLNDDIKSQAKNKLREWFEDFDEKDLGGI
jgi:uncharacterized membrane protein YkvA (DUF1232 family)